MNEANRVSRISVVIYRPIEVVFAFASDVMNLPLYEKGILEVSKITQGPVDTGTTFHLVARQLGMRLNVVLMFTTYEPNRYFSYKVISGPFPVETHYTLTDLENGSQLTAERVPQPHGLWKLMLPIMTIPARQKLFAELKNLKDYLEKLR